LYLLENIASSKNWNHYLWLKRDIKVKERAMTTTEQRLDDLEMRMAHQDKTIGELNDVITAQWKKLELLERQLRRLGEELEAMDGGEGPAANQKPPHY
jgi:SlyX protein